MPRTKRNLVSVSPSVLDYQTALPLCITSSDLVDVELFPNEYQHCASCDSVTWHNNFFQKGTGIFYGCDDCRAKQLYS